MHKSDNIYYVNFGGFDQVSGWLRSVDALPSPTGTSKFKLTPLPGVIMGFSPFTRDSKGAEYPAPQSP